MTTTTGTPHEELLRLRLAVEASGEVIFMTDASGLITYVNPEFVRLYGYGPSEVIGRSTPRLLKSGSTTDEQYEAFWRELRQHRVVRREFVNRTKDGRLVQIESSANPIFIGDELVGFLAVQRDITARKATEVALRESEARYRTLAEAAHDSIFIVDREGRIEYANSASRERFGLSADEQTGRRLHDVFPPATADEMWRDLSTVFSTGAQQYRESKFHTTDGELWLETWLAPIPDRTGDVVSVMGIAREISERKRLERQLMQAQKMEAIGRLAGGIAHDFNNLLTAILGYSDLLIERASGDETLRADLEQIRKAGERAGRLTRQLLAFSRKQPIAARVLDLNDLISDLERMLVRVIGEDIDFEFLQGEKLGSVKADPGHIEQLLMNLVVNARDAMPKGGRIRIATRNVEFDASFVRQHEGAVAGKYVRIDVQDTGCGMTPEVLAHVFEPFFTTKPSGKGTGLGLATVYGIVKQSGGYITIDSAPGAGTTVTTYFPRVNALASVSAANVSSAALAKGSETILVAEDQPGVRTLIRRILQPQGYTVLMGDTAADVLAIAERHEGKIDLLVSDVIMPGMSGPDLTQRILRHRPEIKVLYISGFTTHPAISAGALGSRAAFLMKPFSPKVLARKVRECLDTPAAMRGVR
jgi:PAS domain S-box-containing protein